MPKNDHKGITELIWFQFLVGAQLPSQIESNLIAFRQLPAMTLQRHIRAANSHTPGVC